MHLSRLIPFLYEKKKYIILASNIVIVQIMISITSSPSGTGFYVMRWVKYGGWWYEKYQGSSLIRDFVFASRKMGCIRRISLQVYNKWRYITPRRDIKW